MRYLISGLLTLSCSVALLGLIGIAQAADALPILRTAAATNEKPFEAGKAAAQQLADRLGAKPQVVLVADCFEDRENKEEMLKGVASVLNPDVLIGGSFYGMYTQDGVVDADAVALLGIAGDGLKITTALEEKLGAGGVLEQNRDAITQSLSAAGGRLAAKLPGAANAQLLILISDAHSPKNQLLLDGVQAAVGKKLPITGASVNKNAGQNWIYYRGKLYTDSAVAVMIQGPLSLGLSGRQAKDNDRVIATARESAQEAMQRLSKPHFAMLAFDCAGRKGKLKNLADELAAIQAVAGKQPVLFGCYGAGEYGPADTEDAPDKFTSCGRGWHIMVSALGQ